MSPINTWMLLAQVLFGAVGAALVIYGWKQRAWRVLIIGCSLSALPFLSSNIVIVCAAGVCLCAALYFWRE